jgi:hypothetical protein
MKKANTFAGCLMILAEKPIRLFSSASWNSRDEFKLQTGHGVQLITARTAQRTNWGKYVICDSSSIRIPPPNALKTLVKKYKEIY